MANPIELIRQHVNRALSQQAGPLYLDVDDRLRLRAWQGRGERLGGGELQQGQSLEEALAFLATADPTKGEAQVWRFMTLQPGVVCHVHVVPVPGGWGVALLDADAEHAEQQARQQVAHELLLLRNERERLLADLRQANRIKSEFIARMSHEFRTPLASVIGYSDTLGEMRPDDPDVQYHLGAVGRGARYLLNLVENLLDQARLEDSQLSINPAACDLQVISDEIEQLLRPVAEQKQLSFAWWFDASVPPRLWIDAARLKQILINLVGNAIKFTRHGGISVEFTWASDRLEVSVTDTGPGIPANEAEVIFQPFRQGGERDQAKGAGLGLSISQALVGAMGGEIRLQEGDRQGSTFVFAIDAPGVRGAGGDDGRSLEGLTLVIADDDPDLLELLRLYLEAAGCRVEGCSDATTAERAVARSAPDAVILDLNLGEDSGLNLAETLRDRGYRGKIACLSAEPQGAGGAAGGFDAVWSKPFTRGHLLASLGQLLG